VPLIEEALRNRYRGRNLHIRPKNILYFVIDRDCDSNTEPDTGIGNYDDEPRFMEQAECGLGLVD
jgi:hypothetical protein